MRICSDYVGEIVVEFPWFLCWLFYSYMLVICYVLFMALIVNYLVIDGFMNVWTNKCCCIYVESA